MSQNTLKQIPDNILIEVEQAMFPLRDNACSTAIKLTSFIWKLWQDPENIRTSCEYLM